MSTLLYSDVSGFPCRHGKVRDIYDLGDRLVLVATDRISAFDVILPTSIPDKGKVLTQMSTFWFDWLEVSHHCLSTDVDDLPAALVPYKQELAGRTMIVQKTKVVPVECVVRGYLAGSGWKEYQQTGTVCNIVLPHRLRQAEQLPEAIFTPATKASKGHDQNISFETMCRLIGEQVTTQLCERSINIYQRAAGYARKQGIIIADTKFEWGRLPSGELILIDEVLTPDSSRFWPADQYQVGMSPPSFDKQFVRDWLETSGWDKESPPPELPNDIVAKTREKYLEAYERLSGKSLAV